MTFEDAPLETSWPEYEEEQNYVGLLGAEPPLEQKEEYEETEKTEGASLNTMVWH